MASRAWLIVVSSKGEIVQREAIMLQSGFHVAVLVSTAPTFCFGEQIHASGGSASCDLL
jgi:hypothetical protein